MNLQQRPQITKSSPYIPLPYEKSYIFNNYLPRLMLELLLSLKIFLYQSLKSIQIRLLFQII